MVEIAFYHLEISTLEITLSRLLEKTLDGGNRALILAASKDRLDQIDESLWTYRNNSWLPHGLDFDSVAEEQPILLSTSPEAKNGAKYLFLIDGVVTDKVKKFERCFEIFNGANPDSIKIARKCWALYKAQQYSLTYWQEDLSGQWKKKVESDLN